MRKVCHLWAVMKRPGIIVGKATKFIFDLDGTITCSETLPLIAKAFDVEAQIADLTERTVRGNVPFVESFIKRVGVLGDFSVSEIDQLLATIPLFENVLRFIADHADDCIVATGNLDVWTASLLRRVGCRAYCSTARVANDKVAGIDSILRKADIVAELQAEGHRVVYIGEGNNDVEAMRLADYSVASGMVHRPANSVMAIADFAVYAEGALVRLLRAMAGQGRRADQSVVISCAGIGSRLGLGSTKALINFNGRPLIQWQLSHFEQITDIRIVVGFQAEDVIAAACQVRRDVIFAFNHDYFSTGTGKSLFLGSRFANETVIAWDGDLVVHRDDIALCLEGDDEYLGISPAVSEDAVFVDLDPTGRDVTAFKRAPKGDYEWSGPARVKANRIRDEKGHVFTGLIGQLPLPARKIRAFDIDTPADYEYALGLFGTYEHE